MRRNTPFFSWPGVLSAAMLSWAWPAQGDDAKAEWPQWRGPNRDGVSLEKGLHKTWPEGGPAILWRIPAGEGYSGISVAGGHVYTMFNHGDDELAVCLDAASGREVWRFRSDSRYTNGDGNGPRSTPTSTKSRCHTFYPLAALRA